jgi:hypothetical protein
LDRLLRRCLAKDPEGRWEPPRDLKAELEWVAEGGAAVMIAGAFTRSPWRKRSVWITFLIVLLFLAVRHGPAAPATEVR